MLKFHTIEGPVDLDTLFTIIFDKLCAEDVLPSRWLEMGMNAGKLLASDQASNLPAAISDVFPNIEAITKFLKLRVNYFIVTLLELNAAGAISNPTLQVVLHAFALKPLDIIVDELFKIDFLLSTPILCVQAWTGIVKNISEATAQLATGDTRDIVCLCSAAVVTMLKSMGLGKPAASQLSVPAAVAHHANSDEQTEPVHTDENACDLQAKYSLEDLYTFNSLLSASVDAQQAEKDLAIRTVAINQCKALKILYEIPSGALSTPFLKMLCFSIETALYWECFRGFAALDEESGGVYSSVQADLATQPPSYKFMDTLQADTKFMFAGEVGFVKTKPSLLIGAVLAGDQLIPIYLGGQRLKSLSSDTCFVASWLFPERKDGAHASLTFMKDLLEITLPEHINTICMEKVSMKFNIFMHSLRATAMVGRSQIELTRDVYPSDEIKFTSTEVSKTLGASPILSQLAAARKNKPEDTTDEQKSGKKRTEWAAGHLLK